VLLKLLKEMRAIERKSQLKSAAPPLVPSEEYRRTFRHHRWAISCAILAIFFAIATLDRYAAAFAIENKMPGDLRAFFQCMSFFGHGTGVLIAISLIWSLDRKNKIAIPLVIGSALMAGAISTIIKILVHRPRPFVDPATISDGVTLSEAVFETFLQSFPSGHTATAFALAMSLSLLYRQGKPMFFLFAALAGFQRIISQNHFPSDVIAGALVGVVSAQIMLVFVERRLETRVLNRNPSKLKNSNRQQSLGSISTV